MPVANDTNINWCHIRGLSLSMSTHRLFVLTCAYQLTDMFRHIGIGFQLVALLSIIDKSVHNIRIKFRMLIIVSPARESPVCTRGIVAFKELINVFLYSTRAKRFLLGNEFL
jgi:type III secretory pathway component EscR